MILVAGGTGLLGSLLVPLLTARGLAVRILTRDAARAAQLTGPLVEVAVGDVRDRATVDRALSGVDAVVSAIQGFGGLDPAGSAAIDRDGNAVLIDAAVASGVDQFVLVSIAQAAADHPIELFRMKFAAEERLRASALGWTILRPTAYMETWFEIVGRPIIETGRTRVFGRGDNPINFVSAVDVARFAERAVTDPALIRSTVEIPGPANVSFNEFASRVAEAAPGGGRIAHVPRPMLELLSLLIRPFKPVLAAQIGAALVMDTRDMAVASGAREAAFPTIPMTPLAAVVADGISRSARALDGIRPS